MGRITFTNVHCTQSATGTHDGVMTFVAPDGSSVVTTYTGYGYPDHDVEAYVLITDFTITGGTGRFAGATGGGPCYAQLNWAEEEEVVTDQIPVRMRMDGRVAFAPGKARGR